VRYLIVSDIHANLEALQAVLADARGAYDQIVCCGDLVGYGADPDAVCAWARENTRIVVRGNHDRVCACGDGVELFNERAQAAAAWTRAALSPESLAFLQVLEPGPCDIEGALLAHGSPLDEDEYILSTWEATRVAARIDPGVYFFGHSHLQGGYLSDWKGAREIERPALSESERTIVASLDRWYLINPGAVGQPRDGDPRAAYAIYRSEDRAVTYRRVAYDIEKAQGKILRAGLPASLAERLAVGR